jgi:hypothetical protein
MVTVRQRGKDCFDVMSEGIKDIGSKEELHVE